MASSSLPPLEIPPSQNTVTVSIINTTARVDELPSQFLYDHSYPNFTHLNCPCFAFLIEHAPSGQKLLFDLGVRKDWENLAPSIMQMIKAAGVKITVEKDVAEILQGGGIDLKDVNGIIWSHPHCDHTGSPARFPPSTALYVGPGFTKAFTPGFPANPAATILETDYRGRELKELSFGSSDLVINGFLTLDFFGNGSFYLLDAPGHCEAHMCALARTKAETFVLLGADAVHHGGELRPTKYVPLPEEVSFPSAEKRYSGKSFAQAHRLAPSSEAYRQPFLICKSEASHDEVVTRETIERLQVFDASENVLMMMAHDQSLMDVVGFWPETANEWKVKGWKQRLVWSWLEDFKGVAEGMEETTARGGGE